MEEPQIPSEKILPFRRRSPAGSDESPSALSASTEDDRLTWPVRVLSIVLGLFLAALGLGIIILFVRETLRAFGEGGKGISELGWLSLLPLPILFAWYGLDLVGRGLIGRPWSRRFWDAAGHRLVRLKPWQGGLVLLVFWVIPAGVLGEGPRRLEGWMVLLTCILHVFFHETGHLCAARAVGYRPKWLSVGPLIVHVDGPRTRVSWSRSWLQWLGGLSAYDPIEPTRAKNLLVICAGPLTNLALAAGALEIWGWPNPSSVFEVFLRTFIGLGIFITILNLTPLPRTPDGFALDGREILDLMRGRRRKTPETS
jgi:hypothetical protein